MASVEEEGAPPGFAMPLPLLPPPPAEWAACGGDSAEEEEVFQEYDAEEEFEDEEYEDEEYEEDSATAEGERSRVLIARRPQAAASGPNTPPLHYDQQLPPNYTTVLCRHYQAGSCSHGNRCNYAHGESELQQLERQPGQYQGNGQGQTSSQQRQSPRHPMEKTAVCRYWQNGYCKHGPRCTFLHGFPERRQQYGQQRQQQYSGQQRTGAPPVPPPQPLVRQPQHAQQPQEEAGQELMAVDPQELVSLLQGTHMAPSKSHASYSSAAANQAPSLSYSATVSAPPPPPPPPPAIASPSSEQQPALSPEVRSVLQRRFRSFLCPMTLEPYVDTVVAADGNIYERRAIEDWLYRGGHDTSPLTHQRLPHKMVMPCGTMRRCVDEVVQFVTAMRQQVL